MIHTTSEAQRKARSAAPCKDSDDGWHQNLSSAPDLLRQSSFRLGMGVVRVSGRAGTKRYDAAQGRRAKEFLFAFIHCFF